MSQKQQSEWINEFNERFIRDGIIEAAGEPVKSFISALLSKNRAETLKEVLPKEKELGDEVGLDRLNIDAIQRDGFAYGFNACRQEIINKALKLGINH